MNARFVLFAAFRAGGLVGVVARPSRRAPSGVVVAPVFASLAAALRFAGVLAAAGVSSPAVRPVAGRGGAARFAVSCPVSGPAPASPVLLAARGLRGGASVPAAAARLAALGL
jgi:hypothetical protein